MIKVKNRQRKTTDKKLEKNYGNICHNAGVNNV